MEVPNGRLDAARAWVVAAVAATLALVGGALALPRAVWDRFLWHYFWGPVYADAHNARCAVKEGGSTELVYAGGSCAETAGRVVAEPGYTVVSEVGYAVVLLFMLVGVLFLLRRLEVGTRKGTFYALVPFMFFGGALRVVEDANDAVPEGAGQFIAYPWNALIISPVIYFSVFALVLVALWVAVRASRAGHLSGYDRPVAAVGTVATLVTVGYLAWLGLTADYVGWYPQVTVLTLGLAGVLAGAVYLGAERLAPGINAGTGRVGLVVIFGHAVDGVANVLAADWTAEIGLPETLQYGAKHPVNRAIIDVTQSVQPAGLSAAIGDSWPFLVVKLVAATVVVWVFDETVFEDSPRYAILLLVAILAVGLGPGSRDMLRVTFGI